MFNRQFIGKLMRRQMAQETPAPEPVALTSPGVADEAQIRAPSPGGIFAPAVPERDSAHVMPRTTEAAVMPPAIDPSQWASIMPVRGGWDAVAPAVTGAKVLAPPQQPAAPPVGQQVKAAVMPTGAAMARGFGAMRGGSRPFITRGRALRVAGVSPVQQGMAAAGASGLMASRTRAVA